MLQDGCMYDLDTYRRNLLEAGRGVLNSKLAAVRPLHIYDVCWIQVTRGVLLGKESMPWFVLWTRKYTLTKKQHFQQAVNSASSCIRRGLHPTRGCTTYVVVSWTLSEWSKHLTEVAEWQGNAVRDGDDCSTSLKILKHLGTKLSQLLKDSEPQAGDVMHDSRVCIQHSAHNITTKQTPPSSMYLFSVARDSYNIVTRVFVLVDTAVSSPRLI